MSVFKRPAQETYSYDFQIGGRRFSGNTQAPNRKEAEAAERKLKANAKTDIEAEQRTGNGPLLLRHATGRYWSEVGEHHRDSAATYRDLDRLINRLGPNKRLDEITDADVAALVAWRRGQTLKGRAKDKDGSPTAKVAPATVNRSTTAVLKKVFTRAKTVWRYQFPREPNWRSHWLKEPQGRVRELQTGEEEALTEAMRGDYAPWVQFALLTGLRRAETLITWDKVNWTGRTITTIGKGGKMVSTPITPAVAALLKPLQGHHCEAVFTFIANRSRKDSDGCERIKGRRYPITYEGGKTEWQRLVKRAGVANLRFHDLRHTTATRLLRETGNMKIVQQALNHRDIATTARYAHVLDNEVADALQRVAKSHGKSRAANHNAA